MVHLLTSLHSNPCIIHVTPDVREDFGLEAELADRLAIYAVPLALNTYSYSTT